jgi:hypothetical protein
MKGLSASADACADINMSAQNNVAMDFAWSFRMLNIVITSYQ